jgi:hypothetical protein
MAAAKIQCLRFVWWIFAIMRRQQTSNELWRDIIAAATMIGAVTAATFAVMTLRGLIAG